MLNIIKLEQCTDILVKCLRKLIIQTKWNITFNFWFQAAKSGDVAVLEKYFTDSPNGNGFECNHLDQYELSPLHYSAKYNRVEVIKSLLSYGAGNLTFLEYNSISVVKNNIVQTAIRIY